MMHDKLVPLKKGDPKTIELARKGGLAKEERRQKRKTMKEDFDILLKLTLKKGDIFFAEDVLSLEEAQDKNISVQQAMDIAMVQRALMGDVNAYTVIRDTLGEKPSDKVEIDQTKTIEAWAKSKKVKL